MRGLFLRSANPAPTITMLKNETKTVGSVTPPAGVPPFGVPFPAGGVGVGEGVGDGGGVGAGVGAGAVPPK